MAKKQKKPTVFREDRYIGEVQDIDGDATIDTVFNQKTYPFWKVVFELDEDNPDQNSNWYDIETIADDSNTADEDLSDDVIGDTNGTYYYMKMEVILSCKMCIRSVRLILLALKGMVTSLMPCKSGHVNVFVIEDV